MSLDDCESEILDVNLNEIDDKEFDIPAIDQQPTLDSILSLPDDEQSLVDSEVSFAAEFPFPGHAPFVHPVGVFRYWKCLAVWLQYDGTPGQTTGQPQSVVVTVASAEARNRLPYTRFLHILLHRTGFLVGNFWVMVYNTSGAGNRRFCDLLARVKDIINITLILRPLP